MRVKRQQGGTDQGDLLDEDLKAALCHGGGGDGRAGPAPTEATPKNERIAFGRTVRRLQGEIPVRPSAA